MALPPKENAGPTVRLYISSCFQTEYDCPVSYLTVVTTINAFINVNRSFLYEKHSF